MTERERLIDLIINAKRADPETGSFTEFLADFLLAYGVIVPDDDCDIEHLRELVEADKAGRCVVLPCKVGDKVYVISFGKIREHQIISIPFLLSKSVNHICFHAENYRQAVITLELEDFGKTVFGTREEAEAALRKSENETSE